MNWMELTARWNDVVGEIALLFPRTDRNDLRALAGDRLAVAEYVAARHDLTVEEAATTIEDRVHLPALTASRAAA